MAPKPALTLAEYPSQAAGYFKPKGIVSQDEYLFRMSKKTKPYFLNEYWWFSQFLAVFLRRKSNIKFLLASMKSLTNPDKNSNNPLRGACSCFQIGACDSKVVLNVA
jgi:hypothetical protein